MEVADNIANQIAISTHNRVKKISIIIEKKHITLNGECNSFYVKQLAVLALKKIANHYGCEFTDKINVLK